MADLDLTDPAVDTAAPTGGEVPIFECRNLSCGYGPVTVVRDIDFSASAGTVLAVLGPNGAGKSTLLNTLAGLLQRVDGEVVIDGRKLRSGRAGEANRHGVVLVPDDRALFTTLTVRENLSIAHRSGGLTVDEAVDMFPALGKRIKVSAGALSGGEQQMLAVARALTQKPRALLIDEMSMGLAPVIVEELLPVVRRIADETNAVVVLVEQHVRLALEVADEAMVVVHGGVRHRGPAQDLIGNPGLLEEAYLGEG
ncbi:ABC transporter ATP-binding protein [Gordonia humi]|uniref:Branched-chain amino acid transport system ATP-binding protein n=1 Tax=Gordonia humi TaxID=686429 RepID=A0A840EXR0_9ACTN|nr:ABC transporter ATP-binding protein [Gordonia humi]MBB4135128.1 branched-chain amino acid transport system ATP-binding protein [Gordonia humi]